MAYKFAASGAYVVRNYTDVTDPPWAFSCWIKIGSIGAGSYLGNLYGITPFGSNALERVVCFSASGQPTLRIQTNDGTTPYNSESAGTIAANTWTHVAGLWRDIAYRRAYLDGTPATGNTTSYDLGTPYYSWIGRRRISTGADQPFTHDTELAEMAVWNLTGWGSTAAARQTAWECAVASLSKGRLSPLFFPNGLTYYPMGGLVDYFDSATIHRRAYPTGTATPDFTLTGTATATAHPPIVYPGSTA